jgi:hypothetical protein
MNSSFRVAWGVGRCLRAQTLTGSPTIRKKGGQTGDTTSGVTTAVAVNKGLAINCIRLCLTPDHSLTLGSLDPPGTSVVCSVQWMRGCNRLALLLSQEKPSPPGGRPGLSQHRRHQSWSTFKSMTLGSLPPKPRERLALHRTAAWEPTEPPDGDFQTEV